MSKAKMQSDVDGVIVRDQAREDLLQREVSKLVRQKWRVINQSRFAAQLERRRWTFAQAITGLGLWLMFIIPGVIYTAIVGQGKTFNLYIEVTPEMRVVRRKN